MGLNRRRFINDTRDLFFVVVVGQLVLQLLVRVEARPDLVHVLPLQPLFLQTLARAEVRKLDRLHHVAVHFKRKGTEVSDVHTLYI